MVVPGVNAELLLLHGFVPDELPFACCPFVEAKRFPRMDTLSFCSEVEPRPSMKGAFSRKTHPILTLCSFTQPVLDSLSCLNISNTGPIVAREIFRLQQATG